MTLEEISFKIDEKEKELRDARARKSHAVVLLNTANAKRLLEIQAQQESKTGKSCSDAKAKTMLEAEMGENDYLDNLWCDLVLKRSEEATLKIEVETLRRQYWDSKKS